MCSDMDRICHELPVVVLDMELLAGLACLGIRGELTNIVKSHTKACPQHQHLNFAGAQSFKQRCRKIGVKKGGINLAATTGCPLIGS
jgi:hypothetical protein